jgi:hypothetical protein
MPDEVKSKLHLKEGIVGKYQYIYTKGKIRVSLIKLNSVLGWSKRRKKWQNFEWEMCGGGIEGVTRFDTKKDAVAHIYAMLERENGL